MKKLISLLFFTGLIFSPFALAFESDTVTFLMGLLITTLLP